MHVGLLLTAVSTAGALVACTTNPSARSGSAIAIGGTTTPTDGSVDYGTALQVWSGSAWVAYTPGALVTLDSAGIALVRSAIVNDTPYEGAQTFNLVASVSGGLSATGVGTIHDDGTGGYYPEIGRAHV